MQPIQLTVDEEDEIILKVYDYGARDTCRNHLIKNLSMLFLKKYNFKA
jgi:hypothetical protein